MRLQHQCNRIVTNTALPAQADAIKNRQAKYSLALLADYYFLVARASAGYFSVNLVIIVSIFDWYYYVFIFKLSLPLRGSPI